MQWFKNFLLILSFAAASQVYTQPTDQSTYQLLCARCHLSIEIEQRLRNDWYGRSAEELYSRMRATMPVDNPGSLSQEQYLNLTNLFLDLGRVETPESPLTLAELSAWTISAPSNIDPDANYPWLNMNGDIASRRYSELEQINADNVQELEVVWRWSNRNIGPGNSPISQTSPLTINGTMYATAGATRNVVAIDPATGQTLWIWRPQEGQRFVDAPRKGSGKGLAYWTDGNQEVILTVTPGYYLVALNARTGLPLETFGASGWVDMQQGLRLGIGRDDIDIGLSMPPLVVNDVIIVGAAMSPGGLAPYPSNVKGDIKAYDVRSGEELWTFKTIPEPGEFGYDTWLESSALITGNAGVWAPMSADPELGLVYLPVEAPTNDYYGGHRPGNNLFSSSLVALDYRTGEMVWYQQLVHHDIWDWDIPQAPILADLPNGDKVLVQLTKQSMAYIYDRETGEPYFGIEERAVPQTDVPGEWTAATQPFPVLPLPYDQQGFTEADLVDFTPEINAMARERIQGLRLSESVFTPPSLRDSLDGTRGTLAMPCSTGGANWEGGAYDPETGILYVPSRSCLMTFALIPGSETGSESIYVNGGNGNNPAMNVEGIELFKPPYGRITAIDLNTGEHAWMIANADTPEELQNHPLLEGVDIPRTGVSTHTGLLVTQSLLFSGEGQGGGPIFRAHDKASGEILAEITLPGNHVAPPTTYMHEGRQYIVTTVTMGDSAEIVALSLPD
ncbi:MAG: quinoprotein glucose dehydrogenase [Gammaproteobacteria bacterium]|nr:quinoprotein glucose dehydrogenase [Gammaproteobacteria bacterium]|tara:strand:+ start:51401 stop:53596 length:2196 start_codon:yes stop_codon:yes gene_type:complete